MTNTEYIKKFERHLKLASKAENTIVAYISKSTIILRDVNKNIIEITREDLVDYIESMIDSDMYAPSTINGYVSALQSFYSFLGLNYGIVNITKELPRPAIEDDEQKVVRDDKFYEILEKCKPEFACYMLLGYEGSMRISEPFKIELRDVDFDSNDIYIRKSKRNRSRRVPMSERVRVSLKNWIEMNDITDGFLFKRSTKSVGDNMKKLFESSGLSWGADKDYTYHNLRHSGISKMVQNAKDLKTVSEITGTKIETLLKTYVHSSPESRQDAVSVFN